MKLIIIFIILSVNAHILKSSGQHECAHEAKSCFYESVVILYMLFLILIKPKLLNISCWALIVQYKLHAP